MQVYYVQHKQNRKVLNAKGGWSARLTSYRLAEFSSESDAQAAFPPGIDCEVAVRNKKGVEVNPTPVSYFLSHHGKYLNKTDSFAAPTFRDESVKSFATEAEALDKAEALGLDLDTVTVAKAKDRR